MDNAEEGKSSAPEKGNVTESQSPKKGNVEEHQRPRGKDAIKASRRHLELANIIKSLHDELRESSRTLGAEKAWEEHLSNTNTLQEYADAMKELAEIWEKNAQEPGSKAQSRICWTSFVCYQYFCLDLYLDKRAKEERIAELCGCDPLLKERYLPGKMVFEKKTLLDVGSCFNPFKTHHSFEVTAIDLCPADETVYRGDFLKIELENDFRINGQDIEALPKDYFHCVVFSLLLEYMPSSEQRILCCKKAYELLKFEGILVIITPDSQHVGKNAKLMKNWRYTLGKMGFSRIKFEKLPHLTCLVFRKCLDAKISERWSNIYNESEMTLTLDIPQDKESEIEPCLDIPQDNQLEERVSLDISLYSKESNCKKELNLESDVA